MKRLDTPKFLFTLLAFASGIAILAGAYLGFTLGMGVDLPLMVLTVAGLLLWAAAWGTFLRMCLRLRKGESAYTPANGRALHAIIRCMLLLAAVAFLAAFWGSMRPPVYLLMECILLPGVFAGAGLAAKVLHGLLTRAMALEKEQEGVV